MYRSFLFIVWVMLVVVTLDNDSSAAGDGNFTLSRINTLMDQKDNIGSITFSPDGSILATGDNDNVIILWDSKTWHEVISLKGHGDRVSALVFSPDGKTLVSGDNGHKIILWDAVTGKELRRIKIGDDVNALAFSPDGKLLAIASQSKNLLVWDMSSESTPQKLKGHKDDIKAVTFSPDGKYLASCGNDKSIIIWEVVARKIIKQFDGHIDGVNTIAFSPNGKYLASGGNDKRVILWDLAIGTAQKTLTGSVNNIKTLAFINNGEVLVTGEGDSKFFCKIRFWNTENGKILASERSDCSLTNIIFSPNEKIMAILANKITVNNRVVTLNTPQDEPGINDPLELSEVVQVPGTKGVELFPRAQEWFVNNFVSANNVIQMTDKENGIIMGSGALKYEPDTAIGYVGLSGFIHFTVKIVLKDGRFKYTFNDFRHSGTPAMGVGFLGVRRVYEQKYGILTNSEIVPDGIEYGRSSVWNHMREVSFEEADKLAKTLKTQMDKPAKGKNDW